MSSKDKRQSKSVLPPKPLIPSKPVIPAKSVIPGRTTPLCPQLMATSDALSHLTDSYRYVLFCL